MTCGKRYFRANMVVAYSFFVERSLDAINDGIQRTLNEDLHSAFLQNAIDGLGQFVFGHEPDDGAARLLAALEDEDAWNAGHAVLGGDVVGVIDVEFADLDPAGIARRQLVNRRRQGATGAAPRRPEIDDDGDITLHHFLLPVIAGKFHDVRTCHVPILSMYGRRS